MKCKVVKVYDDLRFGRIPYIILEVEESDKLLRELYFEPGYRFVIQAVNHHVGAAGGCHFKLEYGMGVQEVSRKIQYNEADVLGNYLEDVKDIYDVPECLYTEKIWDVLWYPELINRREEWYENTDLESCYKIFIETVPESIFETYQKIKEAKEGLKELEINNINSTYDEFLIEKESKIDDIDNTYDEGLIEKEIETNDIGDTYDKFLTMMEGTTEKLKNVGFDTNEKYKNHVVLLVDKETLKIVNSHSTLSQYEEDYAEYLWLPCEEISNEDWEKVKICNYDENDEFPYRRYKPYRDLV